MIESLLVRSLVRATSGLEYTLSGTRRRAVQSNLGRILGTGPDRDRTARAIFESYHRFVLEYLAQRAVDARALDTHFRFHGMETLYAALARGRGAVVSAPHVGNWELGGLAMARLGFPVHVVTGVQFHARPLLLLRSLVSLCSLSHRRLLGPRRGDCCLGRRDSHADLGAVAT